MNLRSLTIAGGDLVGSGRHLFVVDRQDERRRTRLLLRELRKVAVAGRAEDLHALFLDRLRERANAEAGGVLGAKILVDDDDREAEAKHRRL